MKKLKLTKAISSLLVAAFVIALSPIGINAELKHNSNTDKSYIKGWQLIDGKYYFYNIDGARVHDTTVDGYYLGEDGTWVEGKGKSELQDINMETEKSVYPIGTDKVKIHIANYTNLQCGYGSKYEVYKYEDGEWRYLDFKDNTSFEEIESILQSQDECDEVYKLSTLKDFEKLKPGKYMIVEEINDSIGYQHATAEFELE